MAARGVCAVARADVTGGAEVTAAQKRARSSERSCALGRRLRGRRQIVSRASAGARSPAGASLRRGRGRPATRECVGRALLAAHPATDRVPLHRRSWLTVHEDARNVGTDRWERQPCPMGSKTPRTTGSVATGNAAPSGRRFEPTAARGAKPARGSALAMLPRKPGLQTFRAGATSQRTRPQSAEFDYGATPGHTGSRPPTCRRTRATRGRGRRALPAQERSPLHRHPLRARGAWPRRRTGQPAGVGGAVVLLRNDEGPIDL